MTRQTRSDATSSEIERGTTGFDRDAAAGKLDREFAKGVGSVGDGHEQTGASDVQDVSHDPFVDDVAALGPAPDTRLGHYVIDPDDLRTAIDDDFEGVDEASSPEEARRLSALRRLARDPDTLYKRHLVADTAMVARLEAARALVPNGHEAIDIVLGAARISLATGAPVDVPPLLLLGPPGCGKTFLARALGRALAVEPEVMLGSTMADGFPITGAGPGWRGAGPSRLAEALLRAPSSSPLIIFDEIEKLRFWDRREGAADILLGLLDRAMATAHQDAWYGVPMAAHRTIWLVAANSTEGLSDPLLDRVVVVEIGAPSNDDRRAILQRTCSVMRARLGLDPEVPLDDSVADRLGAISLRRIGPALQIAFGRAVAAGRDRLEDDDVTWARGIIQRGRERTGRRIGF